MANAPTHDCPGCGQINIPRSHLACRPCWFALPKDIRDEVNAAWRARQRSTITTSRGDMVRHAHAVREAMTWYRNRPANQQTP